LPKVKTKSLNSHFGAVLSPAITVLTLRLQEYLEMY